MTDLLGSGIPIYVLHHPTCTDRTDIVADLVARTGAVIIEPVWLPEDTRRGCRESHMLVANRAKEEHPNKPYIVFEDDCVIIKPDLLQLIQKHSGVDLLYFGVSGWSIHDKPIRLSHSWGTHAMYITPKARDVFLDAVPGELLREYPSVHYPVDQIWCIVAHEKNLVVWRPSKNREEKWVQQKVGLVSRIDFKKRHPYILRIPYPTYDSDSDT
jgi:GR25 family glycosyltransferase involved in LPS biosynthesis